jgi:hypothetical protein
MVMFMLGLPLGYMLWQIKTALDIKVKGKVHPITSHEGLEEGVDVQLYSFFNPGAGWGWVVNTTP